MAPPSNYFGDASALGADPTTLFPSYIPEPERLIYEYLWDLTQWRVAFPEEWDGGIILPTSFSIAPGVEEQHGITLPVVRGWPAFPGDVPSLAVALGNESEDTGEDGISAGLAGEASLQDADGNALAWANYYSEPLYCTVIVELVHENRDERDRLHSQLRRHLFPLRRILPARDPLIRRVQVDAEKHEIDASEAPMTVYASVFTVHTWLEMLVPGDVLVASEGTVIGELQITLDAIGMSAEQLDQFDRGIR